MAVNFLTDVKMQVFVLKKKDRFFRIPGEGELFRMLCFRFYVKGYFFAFLKCGLSILSIKKPNSLTVYELCNCRFCEISSNSIVPSIRQPDSYNSYFS